MSKKTNAMKALAKQKQKVKRTDAPLQRQRKNVQRYQPNIPFIPIFEDPFGLLGLAGALFGMIQPRFDADTWICDPCSIRVDARPGAAPLHFCPKCRGPLRLMRGPVSDGPYDRRANSGSVAPGPKCIEAEYEDVTHKRLPAPEKPE